MDPGSTGFHFSIWLVLARWPASRPRSSACIIGLPTLRLRGDYLAIVTLGFGEIMPQIARNGDNFFGTGFNLTNGPDGITPIDPPGFGNWVGRSPAPAGELPHATQPATRLFFWTALGLVLITVF